ncbi:MAG: hypothetical protein AAB578_04770, partial [Elusimicrobiota bacterium]
MRYLLLASLLGGGFAGLGYFSALITKSACEAKVARWISLDVFKGRGFHVLSDGPYDPSTSF